MMAVAATAAAGTLLRLDPRSSRPWWLRITRLIKATHNLVSTPARLQDGGREDFQTVEETLGTLRDLR